MKNVSIEDFKCQCGYEGYCEGKRVNENTDADGNRGMWVVYWDCPECGEEY